MFTNLISTCLLPRTLTNVHKCSQILFPHVSWPERSQMFTNLISMHMSLAQNIHKCSQILFPHVSCPEHSQMFTNVHKSYFHMSLGLNVHKCSQILFPCTCLLPRTFTNVHKSYFHMSLAQNIHKRSHSLFPCTVAPTTLAKFNHCLPETCTKCYLYRSTVDKFQAILAHNICRCS